ncbi:MAG: hypothetical protein JNL52_04470 [Flavobacteriales bacterium]|nr:hypothetical protein [Flavobacteriales bacterium]
MRRFFPLFVRCLFILIGSAGMMHAQGQPLLQPATLPAVVKVPLLTPASLPSPWRYDHLGLFCKLDVQLERRLRFPVLFRLGDPLLVDAWEGKGPLRHLR